jgi:hypothetical protein
VLGQLACRARRAVGQVEEVIQVTSIPRTVPARPTTAAPLAVIGWRRLLSTAASQEGISRSAGRRLAEMSYRSRDDEDDFTRTRKELQIEYSRHNGMT